MEASGASPGVLLEYDGTRVVFDPYVTRLPLGDLLRRRVVAPVSRDIPVMTLAMACPGDDQPAH